MKLAVLIAASFAVLAPAASAQMNCIGQPDPLQPADACFKRALLCLCAPNNDGCHLVWTCQGWTPPPFPTPQKTTQPGARSPQNQSPVGGLLQGIILGRQLRQQREQQQQKQQQQSRTAAAASREQEDEASYFTAGAFNGRFWVRFDPAAKSAFVSGFLEAVKASLSEEDRRRYASGETVGNRVADLDVLYRETDNRNLPIWLAIHIVNLEANGTPDGQAKGFGGRGNLAHRHAREALTMQTLG